MQADWVQGLFVFVLAAFVGFELLTSSPRLKPGDSR